MSGAPRPVGGGGAGRVNRARGPIESDDELEALYRRLEFYPTPPWAARAGGELILRLDPGRWWGWDPFCGQGHMAAPMGEYFERIFATDIHDHGWQGQHGPPLDFTAPNAAAYEADWLVGNPPFELAQDFVELGLSRATRGVAVLIRTTWFDTLGRYPMFADEDRGLAWFAPFAERVPMQLGLWDPDGSTATPASWFVFMRPEVRGETRMPRLAMGGAGVFAGQMIPPGTKARLTKPDDARRFGRKDANAD